jgi:sec-independent protein translocase protein TatA
MPGPLSIWEILIILVVLLLLFGAKRLPEMGRSLGRGMREFKDSITGHDDDDYDRPRDELPRGENEPVVSAKARESDTT